MARLAVLGTLFVALAAVAVPAHAQVSEGDIRRAETSAAEALEGLRRAEADLASAERRLDRIADSLAGVGERLVMKETDIETGREEARARIAMMYMSAGSGEGASWLGLERMSQLPAHTAYLGALAEQDRDAVNRLATSRQELLRLQETIAVTMGEQEAAVARLAAVVEAKRADLGTARGDVEALRARWQQQEEERRAREEAERLRREEAERQRQQEEQQRREEAERRRREAEERATRIGWKPGAGVEPWRPLVQKHFPAEMVDGALRVMHCESRGDPLVVNRYSAASGLFQHLPYYWPSRATRAGWDGADIFDPEANIAVSAWLVRVTVAGGNSDPWAHWSCKP